MRLEAPVVWLASPISPFVQTASVAPAPQTLVPLTIPAIKGPALVQVERLVHQDRVATDQTRPAADQATFVPTPPTPAETPRVAAGQPTPDPLQPAQDRRDRDRRDNDDAADAQAAPIAADMVATVQYYKLDQALRQVVKEAPATPVRVIVRTQPGQHTVTASWLSGEGRQVHSVHAQMHGVVATLSASDAKTAKDRLTRNRIIHAVPHSRLDPEKLAELLGEEARQAWEEMDRLRKMLQEAGYVTADEKMDLTARGIRRIGQKALKEVFANLKKDRLGDHRMDIRGANGDVLGETKTYEFGDPFHVDLQATLKNAVIRGGPGLPVKMEPKDFEIFRNEHMTRSSTVVLLDQSRSMGLFNNYQAAKKVTLALMSLIRMREGEVYAPERLLRSGPKSDLRAIQNHYGRKSHINARVLRVVRKPITGTDRIDLIFKIFSISITSI